MEQLPDPKFPTPPKRETEPKPQTQPEQPKKQARFRRIAAGLAWPSDNYPPFICVLAERFIEDINTFDQPPSVIEIIYEKKYLSFSELLTLLPELSNISCKEIYTSTDTRFYSYIRDFNFWKRRSSSSLSIRSTRSSSFESSLVKIKDLITDKRLKLPVPSLVRSQLSTFSKLDIKNENQFFAVKALSVVIPTFSTPSRPSSPMVESSTLSSWW